MTDQTERKAKLTALEAERREAIAKGDMNLAHKMHCKIAGLYRLIAKGN